MHRVVAAVGFTGSRSGGRALLRLGEDRHFPIPVYAEMNAVNPVILLPHALEDRAEAIAQAFVDSLTLGSGQFCTNPGRILAIDSPGLDRFVAVASKLIDKRMSMVMLTPAIYAAYERGLRTHAQVEGVEGLARGPIDPTLPHGGQATFSAVDGKRFLQRPELGDEIFGPASLLVRCRDEKELRVVVESLEGQLTARLQIEEGDLRLAAELMPTLERKAGRILANDFPTSVIFSDAMVHGGPAPATSDAKATSVGSAAIERFLRPVCYQNLPAELLPDALQDRNPLGIPRREDASESA